MLKRDRPSFTRRKYRAALRSFLKANALGLLVVLAIFAAVIAVTTVVLNGYWRGVAHALLVAGFIGIVLTFFHAITGSIWQISGAWGEDNTSDELRRARRRGLIWGWIDNVETESGDVDHLVVTRHAGVLAIDSKWHSVDITRNLLLHDAETARIAARRARSVLRSTKQRPDAAPVVVFWGGAQSGVPEGGAVVDGVPFIAGHELVKWLRTQEGEDIDKRTARAVLLDLKGFKRRVRPDFSFD